MNKEKKEVEKEKRWSGENLLNLPMSGMITDILNSEEILEKEIVAIGNGAHINIPLKHRGKIAKILILRKDYQDVSNKVEEDLRKLNREQ
jgi:putative transposon-encoded protein